MLRFARILACCALLAVAASGLSACTSGPTVRSDADPVADFTQYRTWGFYKPIAMEQSGYSSWISERIRADVQREMDARGYRYVEEGADLLVNFQGVIEDRTAVWSAPRTEVQWFYSYRHGYVAVPIWYDQPQVSRYREGVLTVDLVDGRRNRLVWTGSASAPLAPTSKPEKRLAGIDRSVTSIFAKYPHRAGS